MRIIDVELHPIDDSQPCEVCKALTNAYVPEYLAWLCFPCFKGLTAVIVTAEQIENEIKPLMDLVDKMYQRHDNN